MNAKSVKITSSGKVITLKQSAATKCRGSLGPCCDTAANAENRFSYCGWHQYVFLANRYEPSLRLNPFDPGADFRKIVEREAAFMGDVGVGEERDVGDSVVADEEIILTEVFFHDLQCRPAAFAPGGQHG